MNPERRMQYMLPQQLQEQKDRLPLIFLPLATLEWHGPHLSIGVDPINAERTALAVAERVGGVVLPTLYMGTEREREQAQKNSLGVGEYPYVVGMDFPSIKGLFGSFYFSEELFALVVRAHIEQCINHGYRYIFVVNGHGAVNHNEVLKRLCIEFSNKIEGVKVDFALSFPSQLVESGAIAHAGPEETSLMMHFDSRLVDLDKLPKGGEAMGYADYGIVDSGGFDGTPGPGHTLVEAADPRRASSVEKGRRLFEQTVEDLVKKVNTVFELDA